MTNCEDLLETAQYRANEYMKTCVNPPAKNDVEDAAEYDRLQDENLIRGHYKSGGGAVRKKNADRK